jgi:hypothetical protein
MFLPDLTSRPGAKFCIKKPDFFRSREIRLFHFVIQSNLKIKFCNTKSLLLKKRDHFSLHLTKKGGKNKKDNGMLGFCIILAVN